MPMKVMVVTYSPSIILKRINITATMAATLNSTVGSAIKHTHQLLVALIAGINRCGGKDIRWDPANHAKDLSEILIALTGIESYILPEILLGELVTFQRPENYPEAAVNAVIAYLQLLPEEAVP